MDKVIPILPCSHANTLIDFYKSLGFELVGQYVRSYIIMRFNEIELHFYSTKKVAPEQNSSMCFISVDNVDEIHDTFANHLTTSTGKIPRSGFPKMTKVRDLKDDRRFTLTDPSGNTFYIGTIKKETSHHFFRDLENQEHAEPYAVLYDLLYSKEDYQVAHNMLPKLLAIKDKLSALDRAKLLLIAIEIQMGLGIPHDQTEMESLLIENGEDENWDAIRNKLTEINKPL